MTIDITEVKKNLLNKLMALHHLTPIMRVIGEIVRSSVLENFQVGGRPKWAPLSPVTIANRRGKKKHKILVDTGRLRNSITMEVGEKYVRVGTNVVYAATHQFGAKKGEFGRKRVRVRAHLRRVPGGRRKVRVREHYRKVVIPWGDIPARPFLVLQPEDIEDIKQTVLEVING